MTLLVGKAVDSTQRCAFCFDTDPAPFLISTEYIKELQGNVQRSSAHLSCVEKRQVGLGRFPFLRVSLDQSYIGPPDPYYSDNHVVFIDAPFSRHWLDDSKGTICLPFFWQGRTFIIEPKRSEWIREFTNCPRNLLVTKDAMGWWLYLPRNQAMMFKLTWGGDLQDG